MPAARKVDPEGAALASRRLLIALRRQQLAGDLREATRPLARVDQAVALWRALPPFARGTSVALAACTVHRLWRPATPSPGWLELILGQLGR
jgi:hypothetical protein